MNHMDEFRGKLCGFWENFRKSEPTLPLFKEDSVDYSTCIPIALHGDEGRGRQKQPVMCVGVQPILPIHKGRTNMSGTFGCNTNFVVQSPPNAMKCILTFVESIYGQLQAINVHKAVVHDPACSLHPKNFPRLVGSLDRRLEYIEPDGLHCPLTFHSFSYVEFPGFKT